MKEKVAVKNIIKRILVIISVALALGIFVFALINNSEKEISIVSGNNSEEIYAEQTIEEVGANSIVSSVQILQRNTGTGPFDSDDTPGNDSSEDNNIIRSFDQITWTLENTMVLKDTATSENYKGGVLEVKAEVPENCANLVKWDIDSMGWAENATVSSDGRTFTAQYSLSTSEVTVPGKQTLIFVLKVNGIQNGEEIQPTFEIKLSGNDDSEKVTLVDNDVIIASAMPRYNLALKRNSALYKEIELTENGVTQKGRLYGYSIIAQLYNDNKDKGLKGIEYPEGEINFDFELKLEKSSVSGTSATEDITDSVNPILYNYKLNNYDNASGYIPNREMAVTFHAAHEWQAPAANGGGDRACYNSGSIEMTQEDNIIHMTIDDYKFNGIFPTKYAGQGSDTTIRYAENIGCFSASYFQIFVPYTDESSEAGYNYYLTVEDKNFSAYSNNGTYTDVQMNTTDDSVRSQHIIWANGSFSTYHWLQNGWRGAGLYSHYSQGDAKATIGQKIVARLDICAGTNNDIKDTIYDCNELIKFDGVAFKVTEIGGASWKTYVNGTNCFFESDMQFQMLYAAKKDGTNWSSDAEMKSTKEEDLLFFTTEEELKANLGEDACCVGVLFESISGTMSASEGVALEIALEVTNNAITGNVYQFISTSSLYKVDNKLDRTTQTRANVDAVFPTADVFIQHNYIKSAYDENGSIISGTHNGSYTYGQSVLIISGKVQVFQEIVSKNDDGTTKINYDIGKNENIVTYSLKPQLDYAEGSTAEVTNITVTVEDTLPEGMRYVPGSCEFGEPEVTNNADGTQTLIWEIYNCSLGQEVETIIFNAKIDEESTNGIQYTNTVIVSADKVEPSLPSSRTAKTTIEVINLSSYSFYKTTETPIIEVNGVIHYKITMINKTDESIPKFQLLDILPYNGDNRGTNFNGTYTVKNIDVVQTNTSTGEVIDNSNLSMYVSSDESVRTDVTAKDEDLGTTSIWNAITSGQELNTELTAYAVVGQIAPRVKLEADIYLQSSGNHPYDNYRNSATAQTNENTEEMQTPIIIVQDVKRILNGKVWFDSNKDGVINDGEELLQGVKLTLLNEDGTPAIDIDGNEIPIVETDINGEYTFENMVK